jgi:hypothetical protein
LAGVTIGLDAKIGGRKATPVVPPIPSIIVTRDIAPSALRREGHAPARSSLA